jgi:hypothetical protein
MKALLTNLMIVLAIAGLCSAQDTTKAKKPQSIVNKPVLQQPTQDVTDRIQVLLNDKNYTYGALLPRAGTIFCKAILDTTTATAPDKCLLANSTNWFAGTPSAAEKSAIDEPIITEDSIDTFKTGDTLTQNAGLSASLPLIGQLVSASGSASYAKDITVTITGDKLTKHVFAWFPFADAVRNKKLSQDVQNLVITRNYVMTVGDVVISNYKATITVSKDIKADAKASLDKAVSGLGSGANASVNFERKPTGDYEVNAKEIVVAALFAPQPAEVVLADKNSIDPDTIRGVKVSAAAVTSAIAKSR